MAAGLIPRSSLLMDLLAVYLNVALGIHKTQHRYSKRLKAWCSEVYHVGTGTCVRHSRRQAKYCTMFFEWLQYLCMFAGKYGCSFCVALPPFAFQRIL